MDGKSKDLITDNIEKIQVLFPEAVTEVADKDGNVCCRIDMEKLSILLGDAAIPTDEIEYRKKYGEKFAFEWSGKRQAIAEALKRSSGTLRPCPEESTDWDNTENVYIEGDNLEVLKLLQDSYMGAIKMIYIDPPYNTGKDFVYKDNYKDNLSNYLEQTNTTNAVNSEASGRYHTNWLNMMYPRLKLARNLLTDDGVIFISIDDNEVANLTKVCDEIFGEENFVAVFPRVTKRGGKSTDTYAKNHDYILAYARHSDILTISGIVHSDSGFKFEDIYVNERGSYKLNQTLDYDTLGYINSLDYPIQIEGETYYAGSVSEEEYKKRKMENPLNGYRWRWSKDLFDFGYKNGWIVVSKTGRIYTKTYLKATIEKSPNSNYHIEYKTRTKPISTIDFIDNKFSNDNSNKEISSLLGSSIFDYVKPTSLIEILTKTSTESSSIILDFFSGSATTGHAVMKLNADDGGNRKYILVQLPEQTPEGSEARKAGYDTIPEIAKERLRRAGKKILEEQKAKAEKEGKTFDEENNKVDIGFKVFKLDSSNVKNWDVEIENPNEHDAAVQLRAEFNKVLDIFKADRSELDMLYEVILKLGLPLTTKVEERLVDGKRAFVVGNGVMVATFAKELSYKHIGQMLDMKADFISSGEFKFVIADESFADSNDKTNAVQLFKQRGITNFEII